MLMQKKRLMGIVLSLALGAACCMLPLPASAQSAEAVSLYNQGIQEYTQGRTVQALKLFQDAIRKHPQYADAYYNMGSIYYQMHQYDKSRAAFAKSVELSPADSQARYNLALAQEKLSDIQGALKTLGQIPTTDKKYEQTRQKIAELKAAEQKKQAKPEPAVTAKPSADQEALSRLSQQGSTKPAAWDPNLKLTVQTFSRGFTGPTGITIGPGGFMYAASYTENTIYKIGASGDKVVFVKGEGLQGPIGLTYNPKTGDMYAANYLKNNVVRIGDNGKVSVLSSGLNKPYNLFLDSMNNILYVSEQETNTISKIALPN